MHFETVLTFMPSLQTPKTLQPFLDATLHESYCAPARIIFSFSQPNQASQNKEPLLYGVKQEIPDGAVASIGSEIPYDRLETLIDVRIHASILYFRKSADACYYCCRRRQSY